MAATPVPQEGISPFRAQLADIERRLRAIETQQQLVISDPTGVGGDPAHGNALVVFGSLLAICGISAFGVATFKSGAWVQVL